MDSVQIIILAAGKGKRMESELPKPLIPLLGKSMVGRVVEAARFENISRKPILVISPQGDPIRKEIGGKANYVIQEEQLGTGHAVWIAKEAVPPNTEAVMILYADHPLVRRDSLKKVIESHLTSRPAITMATVEVSDWREWREGFYDFGRIIRNKETGKLLKIVERKDASPEELEIKELNPSYFCFDAKWLWKNLPKIKNENAQKEYYLTELIKIASEEKAEINTIPIDPIEALGANTKSQFFMLENLYKAHFNSSI